MGRHYHYKQGDFYRTSDRTGFPVYASGTRKQWNNLITEESTWETRQPQDLVRGRKDNQVAPDARPLSPPTFVGPIYVQLSQAAAVGATDIYIESIAGLSAGDQIGIMLDNGIEWLATIVSIDPGGAFVTITPPLP